MIGLLCFVLAVLASPFESKLRLEVENAVLRHQLIVLRRRLHGRVRLTNHDRWFFIQLYRWFPSILQVLTIIRPETLVRWHRAGFRCYWRWKSRPLGGRPQIDTELRASAQAEQVALSDPPLPVPASHLCVPPHSPNLPPGTGFLAPETNAQKVPLRRDLRTETRKPRSPIREESAENTPFPEASDQQRVSVDWMVADAVVRKRSLGTQKTVSRNAKQASDALTAPVFG
jgi:hypothetical protein